MRPDRSRPVRLARVIGTVVVRADVARRGRVGVPERRNPGGTAGGKSAWCVSRRPASRCFGPRQRPWLPRALLLRDRSLRLLSAVSEACSAWRELVYAFELADDDDAHRHQQAAKLTPKTGRTPAPGHRRRAPRRGNRDRHACPPARARAIQRGSREYAAAQHRAGDDPPPPSTHRRHERQGSAA